MGGAAPHEGPLSDPYRIHPLVLPKPAGCSGNLSGVPQRMDHMSERLVNIHLIEEGVRGSDALFEVSLLLDDDAREGLRLGRADAWRGALGRAQQLVGDHVAQRRAAEGLY